MIVVIVARLALASGGWVERGSGDQVVAGPHLQFFYHQFTCIYCVNILSRLPFDGRIIDVFRQARYLV